MHARTNTNTHTHTLVTIFTKPQMNNLFPSKKTVT